MNITIQPGLLKGKIKIPPSKSIAHRTVICAALADGVSTIKNIELSDDIIATIRAMKSLGASIENDQGSLKIKGTFWNSYKNIRKSDNSIQVNCNESGSTLRFLIPIMASFGGNFQFVGQGNLGKRPLDPYYDIFEKQGISHERKGDGLDLRIQGQLRPGTFQLPGNISSQFISGLLFALPLLKGDSNIKITTSLESIGYIDLSLSVLKNFGIQIQHHNHQEFFIKGNQRYRSKDYSIEGDYSQAAFFLVADALGHRVIVEDLEEHSMQSDRAIVNILENMGMHFVKEKGGLKGEILGRLKATKINGSQCPDIIPILSAGACLSKGVTEIIGAQRLRMKESDRLSAIYKELTKLGAKIQEKQDGFIIEGVTKFKGNQKVWSHKDHRIAMTLAIIATVCDGPVTIKDAECVSKSYPRFWEDFKALGGKVI